MAGQGDDDIFKDAVRALPRLSILFAALALGSPLAAAAQSSIDADRLWRDLEVLAHDSMQGRRVGTEGSRMARVHLVERLAELGLEPVLDTFTVERGGDTRTGVNVRATVRGTEHPERYLVLTAHYDHLGVRGGEVYNGTDDNASGSAGVLALAGRLVERPPRHSVVLALLDAEEGDLDGARHLVASFPVPLDRVLVNLNLDMIARSRGELWVSGTYPYPALRPLVEAAEVVPPVFLRFGHDTPEDTGADNWVVASDHAAFHREGVPFLYFGVADHPGYHDPTDDIEHIDPAFYVAAVETVAHVFDVLDRSLEGRRPGG